MKTFFKKLILWLPLAFLTLVLANMFFIHEYLYMNGLIHTRYSVLQTQAFAGLTLSLCIALIFEARNREPKKGIRLIYKWYISIPLIVLLILMTLASMNR